MVFSFVVVDIMYSFLFALFHTWETVLGKFWFGFVQLGIGIILKNPLFYLFITFTYLQCELMDEGWNDVKHREITCILNLTKGRTKNRTDLPPNLRLRSRLHGYVFKSFHFHFVAFSNRSTLDCVFKCLRFDAPFHVFRANRR